MYLKKIEAQGFKSFANKTVLEFTPGIIGIVGPNGSGKSNVADAVRWVLGEQSAKTLRGSNMQDVIFAGTENRRPQGYAYVTLVLDNTDHSLSPDFEDVVVTRRVYRSGESEYLLNGSTCRLRDILELFYDTGVGKEGYSIIGQGQIDKILSSKPEDRRELFDEAAGIVKFKKRKSIAVKKLEKEQQDLLRVSDIVSELEHRIGPLRRQAETAKEYLKLREELKQYEIGVYFRESEEIAKREASVEEKTAAVRGDFEESTETAERSRTEYETTLQKRERLDRVIDEHREKANSAGLEKENAEGRISLLNEQIRSLKANEGMLQERLAGIEKDRQERAAEKDALFREKGELDRKIDETDDRIGEAEEDLADREDALRELEQLLDEKQNALLAEVGSRADLAAGREGIAAQLEQARERTEAIRTILSDHSSLSSVREEELDALRNDYEVVCADLRGKEAEEARQQEKNTAAKRELEQLEKELAETVREYHIEQSRLTALVNIAERYDGYGESIKRVMGEKKNAPKICGVVADLIQAEPKYETAIETALGGRIQNVVTEDEETAKRLVAFLKKNRFGRVTFLPIDAVRGGEKPARPEALREPGIIDVASRLVRCEAKYENVVSFLLGRVLVADTVEHALAAARKYNYRLHIVTLEGEYLAPGGAITGGAFKNSSNLLNRRREIEALETAVQKLRQKGETLQDRLAARKKDAAEGGTRLEALQASLQELKIREATLALNVQQAEAEKERVLQDRRDKEAEQSGLYLLIQELSGRLDRTGEKLTGSEEREAAVREESDALLAQIETARAGLHEKQEALTADRLEFSRLSERSGFLLENLRRLSAEIARLDGEKEELLGGSDPEGLRVAEKIEEIVALEKRTGELAGILETQNAALEKETAERDELAAREKYLLSAREDSSARAAALDKELLRLQNQAEKLKSQRESAVAHLWDEYGMTASEAEAQRYEGTESLTAIRRAIAEHKNAIKALGSVNVNAIEEEKEIGERYDFMSGQLADLTAARDSLLGIITELDDGMKRQFDEKFAEIRSEFDRVFRELFGGGKGTLELLRDEDDELESGIAIIAQPPGKKLQNMMQLSGGEKALTAIALIFAIQNLKPSPFCLVDEIEAALDEPNVDRFAAYLKKLKQNTQIIAITHRRGTMEAADRLYGITMQEKGVSTLISVDLTDTELTGENQQDG